MISERNLYNKNFILVMDNCRIHKSRLYNKIKDNLNILFLPKYSPFLNPIEKFFGFLKKTIKKKQFNSLDDLLRELKDTIINTDERIIFGFKKCVLNYFWRSFKNENILY